MNKLTIPLITLAKLKLAGELKIEFSFWELTIPLIT